MWRRSCHRLLCSFSLLLWQALTYLAASTAVALCSLSKWCSSDSSERLWKFGVVHVILVQSWVLMSVYVSQCSRKCCSVSTCLCGQSRHSRSSLSSHVCLCQLLSKARLWSLYLYLYLYLQLYLSLFIYACLYISLSRSLFIPVCLNLYLFIYACISLSLSLSEGMCERGE